MQTAAVKADSEPDQLDNDLIPERLLSLVESFSDYLMEQPQCFTPELK